MKRFLLVCLLVVAALPLSAQEATITSPVARSSVAKIKVDQFAFDRLSGTVSIRLVYQDSSNADVQQPDQLGLRTKFSIPSLAGAPCTSATTLAGLAGAMNAARSGETGGNARIQQFRILGYLSDQGCITGVTLVP